MSSSSSSYLSCQDGQGTSPLISIIMPAYNAEAFIRDAIGSVLTQSNANWELIVVNDQSSDATDDIIRSFPNPQIRYYQAPQRFGRPSAVKNYGSRFAQGEFLFFFDSDDVMLPDALDSMVRFVEQHPHISAAYGFNTHIDISGKDLPFAGFKLVPRADGGYNLPSNYSHTWKRIATFRFVATPNILIRRSVFEDISGFDESLTAAEDMQIYFKLFLQSLDLVGVIPSYLVAYRQHGGSLTKSPEKVERLLNAHLQMAEWLYADSRVPEPYRTYRSFAICKAYNHVAGIRIGQGDKKQAIITLIRGLFDKRSNLISWSQVCGTTLLRCLLPTKFDMLLKSLAVEVRDGVLAARIKQKLLIPAQIT